MRRRPYWKFQWRHKERRGKKPVQNLSTLSRKCQRSRFLFCDATVLLRWSLQYGRRWQQYRCSIQFYFYYFSIFPVPQNSPVMHCQPRYSQASSPTSEWRIL